jgi:hypothetical protein
LRSGPVEERFDELRARLQVELGQELARYQAAVLGVLGQRDQEGQVGVGLDVVGEERHQPINEEFLQDHMAHRHRERRIGSSLSRQPFVGKLGVVGEVRADGHDLGAAVPTSAIQCASGVRVTGTLEPHIVKYVASHQSPDSGTSV